MVILGAYILVGLVVCALVARSGGKSDRRNELPLSMLFDPIRPIVVIWPLWLAVVLTERSFPEEPPHPEPSSAVDLGGQVGVVITALRPLGRIQIGAAHFDARSDGRIIPVGSSVRVVSRSMAEFLVEEEEPNQPLQRNASTGSVSNLKSPARRG